MHTVTVVLLPRDTANLWQAGTDLLTPHRLDEDNMDHPWRLDYWTVGSQSIKDEQSDAALGVAGDEDLAGNVCLVSRLPSDFVPGAVVTPDGRWFDLADHHWRSRDGDSPANQKAMVNWVATVRELFAAHASCVAVEFDTHS